MVRSVRGFAAIGLGQPGSELGGGIALGPDDDFAVEVDTGLV